MGGGGGGGGHNRMHMASTENRKGKTGGTTTEIPTNAPALSKKLNKCEATLIPYPLVMMS